ncbi:type II toxin-antitoxin system RelE/ParE family toxin [Rhodoferax saidenbachensis]|uniref:Plasmid stabilization protein n=1 Tax=Rhodoferax saidenbachensis TaxID=1484693 RepID=A0A1P8KCD9_9BURK|nr:type II toxin-antitoxin system RelE/ParE family toxin [Rhodoferax saidenbachensis]APW43683.1 plasmid stabilization protein [Rhodoferax saidenbachensis]
MSYRVRLTREAAEDLERLFDFVLERELQRSTGDLDLADKALQAIQQGMVTLRTSPFTCRKSGQSPFLRELVISFGRTGYVALFEIVDSENVVVAAVRHQLEDDYH